MLHKNMTCTSNLRVKVKKTNILECAFHTVFPGIGSFILHLQIQK